jgi:Xaa-Pro aminopeptidase
LRASFAEAGIDGLLVTAAPNVRYLSNFSTPQDGRVLVTQDKAILLTDSRYTVQAAEESWLEVVILPPEIRRNWQGYVVEQVGGTLGIEASSMTVADYQAFKRKTDTIPKPTQNLIEHLRRIKSKDEIDALRRAAKLTDEAFTYILDVVKPGVREIDVALELEMYMRTRHAEDKSFDIIVASGPRSAMPHGVASNKVIEAGDLVTMDFGALVDGYHADLTRTVAMGELSPAHKQMYEAVLEAQQAAMAALGPGKQGEDVDSVARDILKKYDLADYFVHGLGHGVGLYIHEQPSLSQQQEVTLEPGMVVTVEPGVYIPGDAGVRIEDLVVITQDGTERLSHSNKELITL